jgi:hypothetical protein
MSGGAGRRVSAFEPREKSGGGGGWFSKIRGMGKV